MDANTFRKNLWQLISQVTNNMVGYGLLIFIAIAFYDSYRGEESYACEPISARNGMTVSIDPSGFITQYVINPDLYRWGKVITVEDGVPFNLEYEIIRNTESLLFASNEDIMNENNLLGLEASFYDITLNKGTGFLEYNSWFPSPTGLISNTYQCSPVDL